MTNPYYLFTHAFFFSSICLVFVLKDKLWWKINLGVAIIGLFYFIALFILSRFRGEDPQQDLDNKLLKAIENNNLTQVEDLLLIGARANQFEDRCPYNLTMHAARKTGNMDIIKELKKYGARE